MNIDQDVASLIGMKEVQNFKLQQDLQRLVGQYNELVATWAFIDGFLLPLMAMQLRHYRARHSAHTPISIATRSPVEPPPAPATLFSDQEAEAVISSTPTRTA